MKSLSLLNLLLSPPFGEKSSGSGSKIMIKVLKTLTCRYDLISATDVLPPGQGNTTLGSGIFGLFNIAFQLGTPNQSTQAAFESTTPIIVVFATNYNSSVSSTYVPTGQNGTAFVNDIDFVPGNSQDHWPTRNLPLLG